MVMSRGVQIMGIPMGPTGPMKFPCECECISPFRGNGKNGNDRVGMGRNGNFALLENSYIIYLVIFNNCAMTGYLLSGLYS